MLAYKIASCEVCIKWRKPIGACKIQCQSPSRRLIELRWSNQEMKVDCSTVHGGTHVHIRIPTCAVPCGMWSIHWRWSHLLYTNRRKWIRDAKFGRKTQFWNWKWNWRSRSIKTKINRDLNSAMMHFRSKFGNTDFNWWWLIARTNSHAQNGVNVDLNSIWPWRSRSIAPQNNRALNQGLLHLWSRFGDPSLIGWWIITRTRSWLTDTRTHTHTRRQR